MNDSSTAAAKASINNFRHLQLSEN